MQWNYLRSDPLTGVIWLTSLSNHLLPIALRPFSRFPFMVATISAIKYVVVVGNCCLGWFLCRKKKDKEQWLEKSWVLLFVATSGWQQAFANQRRAHWLCSFFFTNNFSRGFAAKTDSSSAVFEWHFGKPVDLNLRIRTRSDFTGFRRFSMIFPFTTCSENLC